MPDVIYYDITLLIDGVHRCNYKIKAKSEEIAIRRLRRAYDDKKVLILQISKQSAVSTPAKRRSSMLEM